MRRHTPRSGSTPSTDLSQRPASARQPASIYHGDIYRHGWGCQARSRAPNARRAACGNATSRSSAHLDDHGARQAEERSLMKQTISSGCVAPWDPRWVTFHGPQKCTGPWEDSHRCWAIHATGGAGGIPQLGLPGVCSRAKSRVSPVCDTPPACNGVCPISPPSSTGGPLAPGILLTQQSRRCSRSRPVQTELPCLCHSQSALAPPFECYGG